MRMPQRKTGTSDAVTITRILVPTDFSPGAERALRWASVLAERFGAELIFLHALDLNLGALAGLPSDVAAIPAVEELARLVRAEATEGMGKLATRYPSARTVVLEGSPRALIPQVAEEEGASLIVMGTHGRSGLSLVVFGSVAEHVVRTSRIPVLTVRQEEAA
jgi:nucleotide-binding universal stress UspA family protein